MEYDYSKLRGKIIEKYGSQMAFSKALGVSFSTLNLKLNNKSEWTAPEMNRACELLNIPLAESYVFFLTEKL